jgi:hypothetical protein
MKPYVPGSMPTRHQIVAHGRRVCAARRFGLSDPSLLACEMLSDQEFGLDDEQVIRRHWLRCLRFQRAKRPSNATKIADLVSSVTAFSKGSIA